MIKFDIIANKSQHQSAAWSFLRQAFDADNIGYSVFENTHQAQSEYVACWGWRAAKPHYERGAKVLVMERGYIGDRFTWTSYGWNGLNGRAIFPNIDDSGRRWSKHFCNFIEPRRDLHGDYVLLIGQVEGDAAISNVNIYEWYENAVKQIKQLTDLPVMFRRHPQMKAWNVEKKIPGAQNTPDCSLSYALNGAAWVVTYNSNTGVDAILNGNAVIACDEGAMIWPVVKGKTPGVIPAHPTNEELKSWAHGIAWKQWDVFNENPHEMWQAVKSCIDLGFDK